MSAGLSLSHSQPVSYIANLRMLSLLLCCVVLLSTCFFDSTFSRSLIENINKENVKVVFGKSVYS